METNSKSPLIDLSATTNRLDCREQQAKRLQKTGRGPAATDPDRVELSIRSRDI
jgi:hypothetical protein